MQATILDTVTGRIGTSSGIRSWEWAENNYSCDCNRNVFNVDIGGSDGVCAGAKRFLVIGAVFEDPEDDEFTLYELNAEYPTELLKQFIGEKNEKV